jgi:hypothetical protein
MRKHRSKENKKEKAHNGPAQTMDARVRSALNMH